MKKIKLLTLIICLTAVTSSLLNAQNCHIKPMIWPSFRQWNSATTPWSITLCIGQTGTLKADFGGYPINSIQWYVDGGGGWVAISGATSQFLQVGTNSYGKYKVKINGCTESEVVMVKVNNKANPPAAPGLSLAKKECYYGRTYLHLTTTVSNSLNDVRYWDDNSKQLYTTTPAGTHGVGEVTTAYVYATAVDYATMCESQRTNLNHTYYPCHNTREDGSEELNNALSVSPNPASDKVTVKFPISESSKIQILTTNGSVAKEISANGLETSIDVRDLTPGLYILNVEQAGIVSKKRFQVAR